MRPSWSEIQRRVGGPRAITLTAFLIGTPFWIIGFVFNEPATYQSAGHAWLILAVSLVSQVVMGLTLWLGHLATRGMARRGIIPLAVLAAIWSFSGVTRAIAVHGGLELLSLENPVTPLTRVFVTAAMTTLGYGLAAYALDAFDRFREERALLLRKLLEEEDQLSSHRDTIEGMKAALVAQVEEQVQQSQSEAHNALNRLEQSLANSVDSQPALDELRQLSDDTWQRISQDLWAQPPSSPPRMRVQEILKLWAHSHPFNIVNYALVSVFLYLLIYSRVFEALTGVMMTAMWLGFTVAFSLAANQVLQRTKKLAIPLLFFFLSVVLFSSLPVLVMFQDLGFETEAWERVVIVHAVAVAMVTSASLPPAIARARQRVLENLREHLNSQALEKLRVESQLAIVAQKIANHLHGDVRGNFLATVLNLQGHLDRGDIVKARTEIAHMRKLLDRRITLDPSAAHAGQKLEDFLTNWTSLIDISLDKPVSAFPEEIVPAIHTVIVDAVNNAVRHGGADWIRIASSLQPDAVVLTIHNNGSPNTLGREGLGTANLNLLAPEQWSRIPTKDGTTQLLVKLEKSHVTRVLSRG